MPRTDNIFKNQDSVVVDEPVKKALILKPVRETNLIGFAYEGGGELPDDLKNVTFTNRKLAQKFLDDYTNN